MSAGGEVERLAADLSGAGAGDEEEEWLYGDENEEERPEETPVSVPPPTGNEEEAAAENGVVKMKVTEAEDDSDSDSDDDEDDVQVTIGDIKTGAPQYGYGAAPVNLNIKTGGRSYGSSGAKVKGVDLDAPGSINGVPLLEVDLDSFEDKPWRKPGADLSDYFNYGFNEDTWKAYCEKQKRIRMGLEILPVTSTTNKITAEDIAMEVTPGTEIPDGTYSLFKVQQGRTGNMEKEIPLPPTKAEFTSPPPLFKTGIPSNRNSASSQSQTSTAVRKTSSGIGKWQDRYGRAESPELRRLSGTIDVIGQTITISRVEGRRRANENSNIQVLSERSSSDVDNSFSKPPPFFPPGAPPTHLPPPPFLPPPPSVSTAPPLIPPPGFPPPPGGPPPSLIPTIESGHSSGYDGRSARAFPYGGVMRNDTDTENMQTEAMSDTGQVERKKNGTEKGDTERRKRRDINLHEVTAGVAMIVKRETATGGINIKSQRRAKKEKKQVAVNLPLNRKTLKLPLQNRHVMFLPTCLY
ncbi:pre-mRNA 3'-end-processing factor FIP1 isoform X12 [Candoia aspera]|uniref:pre-mRNA 3'-end-processing factor FIP1 isoform X12 n=1 Tax=Candoia aspera TaxID=51853 RepID=UPI002FD84577